MWRDTILFGLVIAVLCLQEGIAECNTAQFSATSSSATCSPTVPLCAVPVSQFSVYSGGSLSYVSHPFKVYEYGSYRTIIGLLMPWSSTCSQWANIRFVGATQMGLECSSSARLNVCLQWSEGYQLTCSSSALYQTLVGGYGVVLQNVYQTVMSPATCAAPTPPTRSPTRAPTQCSPGCPPSWINDGVCDTACFTPQCNFDGNDCLSPPTRSPTQCSPGCPPSWIGDGVCDTVCFTSQCNFDGNDCSTRSPTPPTRSPTLPTRSPTPPTRTPTLPTRSPTFPTRSPTPPTNSPTPPTMSPTPPTKSPTPSIVSPTPPTSSPSSPTMPSTPPTRSPTLTQCSPGCQSRMVGNGVCDVACFTSQCNFDGNDCSATPTMSPTPTQCSPGCSSSEIGNGQCNIACFTPQCNFDGNDCGPVVPTMSPSQSAAESNVAAIAGAAAGATVAGICVIAGVCFLCRRPKKSAPVVKKELPAGNPTPMTSSTTHSGPPPSNPTPSGVPVPPPVHVDDGHNAPYAVPVDASHDVGDRKELMLT